MAIDAQAMPMPDVSDAQASSFPAGRLS